MSVPELDLKRVDILVDLALSEDLDERGDVTTNSVIPEDLNVKAILLAKEWLVCAGVPVAELVFKKLCPGLTFKALVKDGDVCMKGTVMAEISGPARPILVGERTALNFLQRLCGVATMSNRYQSLAGDKMHVLDTRKTTPGWRNLEKYAVAMGGAHNHRIAVNWQAWKVRAVFCAVWNAPVPCTRIWKWKWKSIHWKNWQKLWNPKRNTFCWITCRHLTWQKRYKSQQAKQNWKPAAMSRSAESKKSLRPASILYPPGH